MILSPLFYLVSSAFLRLSNSEFFFFNPFLYNSFSVGEDEEVNIKQVTDAIVKAVGFQGEYTVCVIHPFFFFF